MIKKRGSIIHLSTTKTSLILRIDETLHLVNEYFGPLIPMSDDYSFIIDKTQFLHGTEVAYSATHPSVCLDSVNLEYPTHGKGDFREPAFSIHDHENQVIDLIYQSDEFLEDLPQLDALPCPHSVDEVLKITLVDNVSNLKVELIYGIFISSDVISRSAIITNMGSADMHISKAASLNIDLDARDMVLTNLTGAWSAEGHIETHELKNGIFITDSKTGNSSNRHNPFFMIKRKDASYDKGLVYGFNLLYSGNHQELVAVTAYHKLRIQTGINPFLFDYKVSPNEHFETPIAIMSVSSSGENGLSQHMHSFINHHIIRGPWAQQARPIILNNWEATYFDFNEGKLLSLMNEAKRLGFELLVLDDGWFGKRNDDTQGLGDYDVNTKKLPHGLDYLADKANAKGLKFGLWFEPEMVNEKSKLYNIHPEWAIKAFGRAPSLGRHQLVLDLSKFEVQTYLIESISSVLDSAHIEYVKWDMNRHITDFQSSDFSQGESYHRYMIGLYRVLKVLTSKYDYILWEGCASGGNRFDLGMLCFFQQIWTSDDTDAYERLSIQNGISLGYPLSSMTCHVATSPSHQTLRKTPLETRFHVAAFGNLGYEMDVTQLTPIDSKAIKEQVAYYKEHRFLFQYGKFYRIDTLGTGFYRQWMVINDDCSEAIIGQFNELQTMTPGQDVLQALGFIEEAQYEVTPRPFGHHIKMFGGLINQVSPIHLNEDGFIVNFIDKRKTIEKLIKQDKHPSFIVTGSALNNGAVKLFPQWAGTGFNEKVRVVGDFGSEMYHIVAKKVDGDF